MRKMKIALCVVVFITALGLTLYPWMSNAYAERHQSTAMAAYADAVSSMDNSMLERVFTAAQEYNRSIGVISTDDPDALSRMNATPLGYEEQLNINGDGIMGYIQIPSIGITLPIFHGVAGDDLERGAGHLPGTSLPVGGSGTHAVIAAHSGLPTQRMFSDLEQMEKGDMFFLSILDRTLAYEVDQILVVEPNDASALGIVPGQDYVTLVTCTPFGINTHRLLLRGRRVPYEETETQEELIQTKQTASTWRRQYLKGILMGLSILVTGIMIAAVTLSVYRATHPRRRYKHEKRK